MQVAEVGNDEEDEAHVKRCVYAPHVIVTKRAPQSAHERVLFLKQDIGIPVQNKANKASFQRTQEKSNYHKLGKQLLAGSQVRNFRRRPRSHFNILFVQVFHVIVNIPHGELRQKEHR